VFNLGIGEITLVLIVALIFLGPKMLPEIATGLGKVIREIRKATADIRQDIELDDLIRKPLQELREAATLPPEELKRRDEAKANRRKAKEEEEAYRKQLEAREAEEAQRKKQEAEAEAQRKQREIEEVQRKQQEAEAEAQRKQREAIAEAQRKHLVAEAEVQRKQHEAEEAQRKQRTAEADAHLKQQEIYQKARASTIPITAHASPSDVISANGTMIANPPPTNDLRTLTPVPEIHTPKPAVSVPVPRMPPALPRPTGRSMKSLHVQPDATVLDLQAQVKAAVDIQSTTLAGRPAPVSALPKPLPKPLPRPIPKPMPNPMPPSTPEGKKG
jgi:Sec-independent protein translocase protein TatA